MEAADARAFEPPGWRAALALGFAAREGRSYLCRRSHEGPLVVQRPFYPEGPSPCHVYVLHPPGGLVAGDELSITAQVDPGAAALLTTPAATKVYRSPRPTRWARQAQRLAVARGAALEWLPQETIVFGGARAALSTRVDLDDGGRFLGWELVCLGRPASGDPYASGACAQRLELWRGEDPLFLEHTRLEADGPARRAAWGLAGAHVFGTLLCHPAPAALVDDTRALCAAAGDRTAGARAAVSIVDGTLVGRYAGPDANAARAHFVALWRLLRPALLGRPSVPPRIWAT
jgi:urease accessory protein